MCHAQVTNLLEQSPLAYCARGVFKYTITYCVGLNSTRPDSPYRVAPTMYRTLRAKGADKAREHIWLSSSISHGSFFKLKR